MPRILYAWELGNGMGHIGQSFAVLSELRARGHDVVAIVADVPLAERWFAPLGIAVHAAPRYSFNPRPTPPTYAGVLATQGWTEPAALVAGGLHWKEAIASVKPDLVLADHGPMVQLAARGQAAPVAAIGTGWCIPPVVTPLPRFDVDAHQPARPGPLPTTLQLPGIGRSVPGPALDDRRVDTAHRRVAPFRFDVRSASAVQSRTGSARVMVGADSGVEADEHMERKIMSSISAVTKSLRIAPLTAVAELFAEVEPLLVVWAELDHYQERTLPPTYWGPQALTQTGLPPRWPSQGTRVAGYLKAQIPGTRPLIEALRERNDVAGYVFVADATAEWCADLCAPNLSVVAQPLELDAVLAEADVVVSHGGMGTVSTGVRHGCVQLVLPTQSEQAVTATRISRLGVGRQLRSTLPNEARRSVEEVLADSKLVEAARSLASKYESYDQATAAAAIVDRCEQLMT